MDSFRIEFKPSARDELWRVPFPFRRLLHRRVDCLKREPRPREAERVGEGELFRISLHGWVTLYEVDDATRLVTIYAFRPASR